MSLPELRKAFLRKIRHLLKVSPTMLRVQEFMNRGAVPTSVLDRIEMTLMLNIINSVEPSAAIVSVHPLQKDQIIAGAWIEDSIMRIIFAHKEGDGYQMVSYDRDFTPETLTNVLKKLAANGGHFINMYHGVSQNIVDDMKKNSEPDPRLGRGLTHPVTHYPAEPTIEEIIAAEKLMWGQHNLSGPGLTEQHIREIAERNNMRPADIEQVAKRLRNLFGGLFPQRPDDKKRSNGL